MIDLQEILEIHRILIQEFGGLSGLRDAGLLKSALERPFSGLGETAFYPTAEEKAAAVLESIVKNHPFADGNKRTGYVLMRLMLLQFGKDIRATQKEKYDFVINLSSGQIDFQEIVNWIRTRMIDR